MSRACKKSKNVKNDAEIAYARRSDYNSRAYDIRDKTVFFSEARRPTLVVCGNAARVPTDLSADLYRAIISDYLRAAQHTGRATPSNLAQ